MSEKFTHLQLSKGLVLFKEDAEDLVAKMYGPEAKGSFYCSYKQLFNVYDVEGTNLASLSLEFMSSIFDFTRDGSRDFEFIPSGPLAARFLYITLKSEFLGCVLPVENFEEEMFAGYSAHERAIWISDFDDSYGPPTSITFL